MVNEPSNIMTRSFLIFNMKTIFMYGIRLRKFNENVHHFCLSLSMTGRLANSIYDLRYASLRAGIRYNQELTSYSGQITKYSAFVFSQNGKFQSLRQYKRRCYYIASKIYFCHKTFIFRNQLSMVKDGRTKNERLSR